MPGGELLDCVRRGKKGELVCGDRVGVVTTAEGQGVIESVAPRSTLLFRSDAYRQKLIAANVGQIVVVLAAVPSYQEELLDRCLAAAEHEQIRALIVLNKTDLRGPAEAALAKLEPYAALGYTVLPLAAKQHIDPLRAHLQGRLSVLVGQSGMGKSTIIGQLLPEVRVRVAELSRALDSGRHTTTSARLYRVDARSQLIDSPGLQEFGLHHLSLDDLQHGFVEFRPFLGACRFRNCRHLLEPGCALEQAVRDLRISARRLASYRRIAQEPRAR